MRIVLFLLSWVPRIALKIVVPKIALKIVPKIAPKIVPPTKNANEQTNHFFGVGAIVS